MGAGGAGEKLWSRTFAVLAEDLGSSPAPTWWLTAVCDSGGSGALFQLLMHMVHIHACRQTFI